MEQAKPHRLRRDEAPLRLLRRDEVHAAVETLGAAFDEDPLFRWFAGDAHDEPRTAKRRREILSWFHESAINECMSVDGVFTWDDDDGAKRGVIATIPPGCWPMPLHRTLRAITFAHPRIFTSRMIRGGLHVEKRIRARHPDESHVYVYLLGVHPSLKGKGLGGQLMRHACNVADAGGHAVHLETSNPVNLPFYARFDLEVKSEIEGHGGPTVWTMTRARR